MNRCLPVVGSKQQCRSGAHSSAISRLVSLSLTRCDKHLAATQDSRAG
ncbi:hypothetical protein ACV347_32355 [Pseudomonas aeruginosa]